MDIRSRYLELARKRALENQLDKPSMHGGASMEDLRIKNPQEKAQALLDEDRRKAARSLMKMSQSKDPDYKKAPKKAAPKKRGRGRPKKQDQKDKEDEKLAMEVKGLEDKVEGGKKRVIGGKKAQAKKAEELGSVYAKEIMDADPEVAELHGAGFWKDFAKGFKQGFNAVMKPVAHVAKAVAPELLPGVAGKAVKAGIEAVGYGKGEETEVEKKLTKGGKKKRAGSAAAKKRGALVSKLMKQKGMKLGEASKYIKAHPELLK